MSDLHHINKARTRNRPVRRWYRKHRFAILLGSIAVAAASFLALVSVITWELAHDCAYTIDRLNGGC